MDHSVPQSARPGLRHETLVKNFAQTMTNEFEMSMMGELTYFLGLQIKQSAKGIFVHQTKYCIDLLKRFDMFDCKTLDTPMAISVKLDPDVNGIPVNSTKYRSMIGALLYLTASRPDIQFAICKCARYQSSPMESHLQAVKRILRYLKGTHTFGLWYSRDSTLDLVGYSDADFAGDRIDRTSTSGICTFLGNSLVSWSSKKQNSIALSTAEAEYVAAAGCCAQLIWMKSTLLDYGLKYDTLPLMCDNQSALNMTKNPVQHSRTKHIDIRHHFIRDHVEKKTVELIFVKSEKQLADIFTKPLAYLDFARLRGELGLMHSDNVI